MYIHVYIYIYVGAYICICICVYIYIYTQPTLLETRIEEIEGLKSEKSEK